jgi:hypothetical protein
MNIRTLFLTVILASGFLMADCLAQDLPEGYWSLEQATEVLDKTRTVTLDPDLSSLTEAEKAAVEKLIKVGVIFNRLYEDSIHSQALESLHSLAAIARGSRRHFGPHREEST